jgi:hypothetical protein
MTHRRSAGIDILITYSQYRAVTSGATIPMTASSLFGVQVAKTLDL